MSSVYNRLAFRGYVVEIMSSAGHVWTYNHPRAKYVVAMLDDDHFPSGKEFAMIIADWERQRGRACRPLRVTDTQGIVLWEDFNVSFSTPETK